MRKNLEYGNTDRKFTHLWSLFSVRWRFLVLILSIFFRLCIIFRLRSLIIVLISRIIAGIKVLFIDGLILTLVLRSVLVALGIPITTWLILAKFCIRFLVIVDRIMVLGCIGINIWRRNLVNMLSALSIVLFGSVFGIRIGLVFVWLNLVLTVTIRSKYLSSR